MYLQQSTCDLNKFFISFNLILCVITSTVSILPIIQEHQPRSGLLQSSVVTLYVVYLTWSGISNSAGKCQWFRVDTINQWSIFYSWLLLFKFADRDCNPGFIPGMSSHDVATQNRVAFDKESIIGLIIWFSCVLYSSLRTASKSSKITMSENVLVQDNGAGKY